MIIKIILVEGKSDKRVIDRLANSGDLVDQYATGERTESNDGGKFKLEKKLNELSKYVYKDRPSIYIILDADDSAKGGFKYVIDILKKLNKGKNLTNEYSIPDKPAQLATNGSINIGIFILPDNENSGCLETLLLKSVTNKKLLDITNGCYNKVDIHYGDKFDNVSLSNKEYFKYLLYTDSVRVLYNNDYDKGVKSGFNIDIDEFKELKNFLNN